MDLKFLVAVICLASIRLSEATVTLSATIGKATITKCQAAESTVSYTKPTVTGGTGATSYALVQKPPTTPPVYSVSSTGEVKLDAASSEFKASSYDLAITISRTVPSASSAVFTLTVAVTDCSGVEALIPSMVVMVISLLSLYFKRN